MWEYKGIYAWSPPGLASKLTKLSREGWDLVDHHYVWLALFNHEQALLRREIRQEDSHHDARD